MAAAAVLKAIETAKAKTAKPEELDALLKVQTNKHLGGKLLTEEARRNDAISHHILRLAYCQSEEKRRWFIAQETALFRWRLQKQSAEQVADFMRKSDMSLEQVRPRAPRCGCCCLRAPAAIASAGAAASAVVALPRCRSTTRSAKPSPVIWPRCGPP